MSLILPANSLTGGYEIDNSLRFNDGSSDYLNRTPSVQGDLQKSTFSFWIKRSNISGDHQLFYTGDPDTPGTVFGITLTSGDTLHIETDSPSLITTRKFRDVSAWYHIVVAVDTTQATASDRVKVYINGTQETSFTTEQYPTLNANLNFNKTNAHYIGALKPPTYGEYYDGYMSEVVEIDGQQLTPTDFGEFDQDTGIWKPIKYTGTYGTNGFYLDFENSGSLGADQSGNGNNFTVNNLTSIDQVTDTPTNNFATMNAVDNSSVTLSEGNLYCSCASPSGVRSTFGVTTGKWYIEVKYQSTTSMCGVVAMEQAVTTQAIGATIFGQSGGSAPEFFLNGSFNSAYSSAGAFSSNDIMQIALDMDSNTVYFGKNGSWFGGTSWTESTPTTGHTLTSGYTYGVRASTGSGTSVNIWNFGNPSFTIASGNSDSNGYGNFEYAVPSGYYSLNSKNLAEFG